MIDWLARLYIKVTDKTYRIKVFEGAVGVEWQPGGPNRLFDTQDDPTAAAVYQPMGEIWDIQALAQLLVRYENEREALSVLDLSTWMETTASHPLPPAIVEHIPSDIKSWQPGDPIPPLPRPHRVDFPESEDND